MSTKISDSNYSCFLFLFCSNDNKTIVDKENIPINMKTEENEKLHPYRLFYESKHWVLSKVNDSGLIGYYVCKHRRRKLCPCHARVNITCSALTQDRSYDRTGGDHTCGLIKVLTGGVINIEGQQREDV